MDFTDNLVQGQLVPEKTLRLVASQINSISSDVPLGRLIRCRIAFLETANSPTVAPPHRTAACNAICALLLRAIQVGGVVMTTVCSEEAILDTFAVFITRSDVSKTRPMRQILSSVVDIIQKLLSDSDTIDPTERAWRQQTGSTVKSRIVAECIKLVKLKTERVKIKPAIQAVSLFISKRVCSVDELIALAVAGYGAEHAQAATKLFMVEIFCCVSFNDAAPATGSLVAALFSAAKDQKSEYLNSNGKLPIWVTILEEMLSKNGDLIVNLQHHVFPGLFEVDTRDFLTCLEFFRFNFYFVESARRNSPSQDSANAEVRSKIDTELLQTVLMKMLQTGKERGLILISNESVVEIVDSKIYIPSSAVTRYLPFHDKEVRASALSLLITSASQTTPFYPETLQEIYKSIKDSFFEADANFRGRFLGFMQRLVDRMRSSMASMKKSGFHQASASTQNKRLWKGYVTFLTALVRHIPKALSATSTYPRKVAALKTFIILLKSGLDVRVSAQHLAKMAHLELVWPIHIQLLTRSTVERITSMLVDPYDDIRHSAAVVCASAYASGERRGEVVSEIKFEECELELVDPLDIIDKFDHLEASTGRADHADGLARCYLIAYDFYRLRNKDVKNEILIPLIDNVKRRVDIASKDVTAATNREPLHGVVAGLRLVLEAIKKEMVRGNDEWSSIMPNIQTEIFNRMEDAWEAVFDYLCDDAPEGYVPENFEEDDQDAIDMGSKSALSFAWRCLKETSLVLQTLVTMPSIRLEDVYGIGNLCFSQLINLRHRGGFTTVAQTFATTCSVIAKRAPTSRCLQEWYRKILDLITRSGPMITRRSAGLPAVIVGLAIGEPKFLERAIEDLGRVAQTPVAQNIKIDDSGPQVHSLNCIKALFTTSQLGDASEQYISMGLQMATSIEKDVWPVRNAGLMLFRALIDRLLGSSNSQSVDGSTIPRTRFSYSRFPLLVDSIFGLLESTDTEGHFPALYILQRAPLPAEHQAKAIELVWNLLPHPEWHVRDMAARSYVQTLIGEDGISSEKATQLLATFSNLMGAPVLPCNTYHGLFLCARYLVRSNATVVGNSVVVAVLKMLSGVRTQILAQSPPLVSAWADALSAATEAFYVNSNPEERRSDDFIGLFEPLIEKATEIIEISSTQQKSTPTIRECELWRVGYRALAHIKMSEYLIIKPKNVQERVSSDLGLSEVLALLAKLDSDEFCNFIDSIRFLVDIVHTIPAEIRSSLCAVMSDIVPQSQDETIWISILNFIPEILPEAIDGREQRFSPTDIYSNYDLHAKLKPILSQMIAKGTKVEWGGEVYERYRIPNESRPSLGHAALPLWAWAWCVDRKATGDFNQFEAFLSTLEQYSNETEEWTRRFAAVRSLAGTLPCAMSWPNRAPIHSVTLDALLNFLQDDDEEIRDVACEIVRQLREYMADRGVLDDDEQTISETLWEMPDDDGNVEMSGPPARYIFRLTPRASIERLTRLIVQEYMRNGEHVRLMLYVALSRLLDVPMSTTVYDFDYMMADRSHSVTILSSPCERTLMVLKRRQEALFHVERRNLYIDPGWNIELWENIARECIQTIWREWPGRFVTHVKYLIVDMVRWAENAALSLDEARRRERHEISVFRRQRRAIAAMVMNVLADNERRQAAVDAGQPDPEAASLDDTLLALMKAGISNKEELLRSEEALVDSRTGTEVWRWSSSFFLQHEVAVLEAQTAAALRLAGEILTIFGQPPVNGLLRPSRFFSSRWLLLRYRGLGPSNEQEPEEYPEV